MRATVADLDGAYALVVLSLAKPDSIVLARHAMPVVVGLGIEENFVAPRGPNDDVDIIEESAEGAAQ